MPPILEAIAIGVSILLFIDACVKRGLWWALQLFVPTMIMTSIIDNFVVLRGIIMYQESFLLWVFSVPLYVVLGWPAAVYLLMRIAEVLPPSVRDGRWLPLVCGSAGALGDLLVEAGIPTERLGWTWLTHSPPLGMPLRNTIGWFLVISLITYVFTTVRCMKRSEMARFLTMTIVSAVLALPILLVLVLVGRFVS